MDVYVWTTSEYVLHNVDIDNIQIRIKGGLDRIRIRVLGKTLEKLWIRIWLDPDLDLC